MGIFFVDINSKLTLEIPQVHDAQPTIGHEEGTFNENYVSPSFVIELSRLSKFQFL